MAIAKFCPSSYKHLEKVLNLRNYIFSILETRLSKLAFLLVLRRYFQRYQSFSLPGLNQNCIQITEIKVYANIDSVKLLIFTCNALAWLLINEQLTGISPRNIPLYKRFLMNLQRKMFVENSGSKEHLSIKYTFKNYSVCISFEIVIVCIFCFCGGPFCKLCILYHQ